MVTWAESAWDIPYLNRKIFLFCYQIFKLYFFLSLPFPTSLKFIYSEKATKFCEIFTLLLSYVVPVKSKVEISQNFVAFSEYMNFSKSYLYFRLNHRTRGQNRYSTTKYVIIRNNPFTHRKFLFENYV